MSLLLQSVGAVLQSNTLLGNAYADLCVSGRRMYAAFVAAGVTDQILFEAAVERGMVTGAALRAAVTHTLDRAYWVASALRNTPQERVNRRPNLDYIAVSGEDDCPHRPVNVLPLPYPQSEVTVRVPIGAEVANGASGATIAVPVRFVVAPSDWADPSAHPADYRGIRDVATEPLPVIPPGDSIVIYIHGHMSQAEEAADLIPELRRMGTLRGKPLTVIAFDMPNCGYSGRFSALPGDARPPPDGDSLVRQVSAWPHSYPCLQLLEDFIVALIEALDTKLGNVLSRIVAVVGGSLGGNLGLRLSRRPNKPPFLRRIASWSPSCAWPSWAHIGFPWSVVAADVLRNAAGTMRDREDEKNSNSRVDYFRSVYDNIPIPFLVPSQPQMWYRDSWVPSKPEYIWESRWARREVYGFEFRIWHWRLAFEQLIFSFQDPDPGASNPRYLDMTSTMLLASGAEDNYFGVWIFDKTRGLAGNMINTPGVALFIKNTGHCIHNERPRLLARAILDLVLNEFASPLEAGPALGPR